MFAIYSSFSSLPTQYRRQSIRRHDAARGAKCGVQAVRCAVVQCARQEMHEAQRRARSLSYMLPPSETENNRMSNREYAMNDLHREDTERMNGEESIHIRQETENMFSFFERASVFFF